MEHIADAVPATPVPAGPVPLPPMPGTTEILRAVLALSPSTAEAPPMAPPRAGERIS
ncbi:hypothetical protein [Streptomyces sp. NPDC001985]|uniref:hypothetical protein n=1 Tax=Streptomyces sp. NPDC001985 TaxID=3154406 RepID=UPI00332A4068